MFTAEMTGKEDAPSLSVTVAVTVAEPQSENEVVNELPLTGVPLNAQEKPADPARCWRVSGRFPTALGPGRRDRCALGVVALDLVASLQCAARDGRLGAVQLGNRRTPLGRAPSRGTELGTDLADRAEHVRAGSGPKPRSRSQMSLYR